MFISDALLRKLDTPGPRYTSYPTADRFHEAFGAGDYQAALQLRGSTSASDPLSFYVHVPFCESVCYYCARNKIVTRKHDRVQSYLDALRTEIALNHALLGAKQPVSQLHFGGGTPTFLFDDELASLMRALGSAFTLTQNAEVSIEVDPRTASPARLQALADMGFNRLSFGIQDFDPAVQHAVHRVQPYEMVRDLMHAAREIGFASINADLIYGLPMQTAESFARTVAQVAALRPDRIALYAYAHLPERFKPQRRIHEHQLPPADARLQMLGGA
ncbi:MAG: oxygen-independent coproporphyrinogen III oxidase, partial [Burkholderiaceae bacterium]